MIKQLLLSACAAALYTAAGAQITITSADVPVLGDTLRYSTVDLSTNMNLSNTGANVAWDYSALQPQSQHVDQYKTVTGAGYSQSGIAAGAYGYQVTDSLGFAAGQPSLKDVYTFFTATPARYAAVGFAARVNGTIAVGAPYTDEDVWLNFPLTYPQTNMDNFRFTAAVSILGSVVMKGSRTTTVDGWGTIVTPYLTTPTQVLRIRSEVVETDSIILFSGSAFAFPRHYVDYQWLANGLRYPALLVSADIAAGQEQPTNIRYRDTYRRGLGVAQPAPQGLTQLQVYPNPAAGATVRVAIPAGWANYETALYDATGKLLRQGAGTDVIETEGLPHGSYTILVRSVGSFGVAQFQR